MNTAAIDTFLATYPEDVMVDAIKLREVVMNNLPDVKEQLDMPAKMIGYSYGQKYDELICMIIPSKKGLKLGFNKGIELPDPDRLLEGTGKITRYVEINSPDRLKSLALKKLIFEALKLYKKRKLKT